MSIYFNEGLPRSGKSLDALKTYIIPNLKKGRHVYAYIEGLNHEQIARLAGITFDECNSLLHQITVEQVPTIYDHVQNDAFVVLDEAQDFWPSGRQKLSPKMTSFITQHGHRGLDILLMGQDISDVHKLWVNRVEQKNYFLKRVSAGKPDEFTQVIFRGVLKGEKMRWQELRNIKGIPYDTDYFGAYASHTKDTENKADYADDRANVWNNPVLKKWIPLYGVVLVGALWYLYHLFNGGLVGEPPKTKPALAQKASPVVSPKAAKPVPVHPGTKEGANFGSSSSSQPKSFVMVEPNPLPDPIPDMVDNLSRSARLRFSGYVKMGQRTQGFIEWRNDAFGVVERLTFDDLKMLGWVILVNQDETLVIMQKYNKRYIATSWPLPDKSGYVPKSVNDRIRPSQADAGTVSD